MLENAGTTLDHKALGFHKLKDFLFSLCPFCEKEPGSRRNSSLGTFHALRTCLQSTSSGDEGVGKISGQPKVGIRLTWQRGSNDFLASLASTSMSSPSLAINAPPLDEQVAQFCRAGRCCCPQVSSAGLSSTEIADYARIAALHVESSSASGCLHPGANTSAVHFALDAAVRPSHALRGGGESGPAWSGGDVRNVDDDGIDDTSASFSSSCSYNSLPFPPRCCPGDEDKCGAGSVSKRVKSGSGGAGSAEGASEREAVSAWTRNIRAAEWWRDRGLDETPVLCGNGLEDEHSAVEESPQEIEKGREATGSECAERSGGLEAEGPGEIKWGRGDIEEILDISVPEEKDGLIRVIEDKPRPEPKKPREELLDTDKFKVSKRGMGECVVCVRAHTCVAYASKAWFDTCIYRSGNT